jgi:hypothetical protein
MMLYNFTCVSSLWTSISFIAYQRVLQLYRTESQQPPRQPTPAAILKSLTEYYAQYNALWYHGTETYRVFTNVSIHTYVVLGLKIGTGFSTVCRHSKKHVTKEIPEANLTEIL